MDRRRYRPPFKRRLVETEASLCGKGCICVRNRIVASRQGMSSGHARCHFVFARPLTSLALPLLHDRFHASPSRQQHLVLPPACASGWRSNERRPDRGTLPPCGVPRTARRASRSSDTYFRGLPSGETCLEDQEDSGLGLPDLRTLAARRHFCAEAGLDRRFAPAIYLGVVLWGGAARRSKRTVADSNRSLTHIDLLATTIRKLPARLLR